MVELIQEQYPHENLNCQLINEAYSTWTPSIP